MNDFVKDTTEIPSLSFGAPEPEPELPVQQPEEKKEVMDDSVLSDEQKAMVNAFVSQIDLANTNGILQYGAGAQKKMADFSEKTLENVRSKDLGEIGDLLTSVVTELKTFDAEEEKGPFSFFKKSTNKINAMKAKYDKAEVNVNKICDVLDGHQRQLLKDIAILDQMYAQNLNYFKELTMYILAGKKKLELVRSTELRDLQNKAQMTGKAEDAQAAKDLEVTPFTKLMRMTSGVIGVMRRMPYMLAISTAAFPFFAHFTAHLILECPFMRSSSFSGIAPKA